MLRKTLAVIASAATVLALAACGSDDSSDDAASGDEGSTSLSTVTDGKLTIATGEPAYSPWVENDDPASGEGFEAAVAYAVADKLGFAKEDVVWVRSTFDSAIAPGAKDWDLNIQQFSITDERKQAVDFSSPYYTTAPAFVSIEGNKGADATSVAELEDATIGAMVGTTTYDAVKTAVGGDIQTFNSNEDAVQALNTGQIDVLAVDLPTALYLAAAELDNGVVVGQIEASEAAGDQFGIVLPKGSELTGPVTDAVDALAAAGTLDELVSKWLTDAAGAPVLK